jgi:hemoglobin-like flavoprotein
MTPGQKNLVRSSFLRILPISDCISALFSIRLLEQNPSVQQLLEAVTEFHQHELIETLAVAIIALDDFESALPAIEQFGRRCAAYGITQAHYDCIAEAFLWSLEQGLDTEFTWDIKQAWHVMFVLFSAAMQAAIAETLGEGASCRLE